LISFETRASSSFLELHHFVIIISFHSHDFVTLAISELRRKRIKIDLAADGRGRYRPMLTRTPDMLFPRPASIVSVLLPFACLFAAPTPTLAHLNVLQTGTLLAQWRGGSAR
jgi:hypothetical protein